MSALRRIGVHLLPTGHQPHFTAVIASDDEDELRRLLACLGPPRRIMTARLHRKVGEEEIVIVVDIAADLNDEDDTGLVWTFLDEARDPAIVVPGAIVVAGDTEAPAVAEVVDLVDKPAGTIVHLRLLPGTFDDYDALIQRSTLPA
ncbi:MAG: hypothetical protein ACRDQ4_06585 [Pseudonocardiaceae bacterium]